MATFTEQQLVVLEKQRISCLDVIEMIGDLHDQELPHTLSGRVKAHLCECQECKALYASYADTVALFGSLRADFQAPQSETTEQSESSSVPALTSGVENRLRMALNTRLGLSLTLRAD